MAQQPKFDVHEIQCTDPSVPGELSCWMELGRHLVEDHQVPPEKLLTILANQSGIKLIRQGDETESAPHREASTIN